MDVTARYRTKYPPKEHEEAVKMLLEGIKSRQLDKLHSSDQINQQVIGSDGSKDSTSGYDCDQASLSSAEAQISRYLASKLRVGKERAAKNNQLPSSSESLSSRKMHSIGTSTASDSVSSAGSGSSSAERAAPNQVESAATKPEAIPSRTIAVQCDLKLSSVRQRDYVADGCLQASSISSTRYGFYSYSPETLARRRRFQRSVSSRDVRNEEKLASKPGGELKLSDALKSELSSSSSCLSSSVSGDKNHSRSISSADQNKDAPIKPARLASCQALHRGWTSSSRVDQVSSRKLDRVPPSSMLDSSISRQLSEALKSRASSQVALAAGSAYDPSRTFAESPTSSSDSDLVSNQRYQVEQDSTKRPAKVIVQTNPTREDSMSLRDVAPAKPPRPTLISSRHNEHIRRLDEANYIPTSAPKSRDFVSAAGQGRDRQSATMSRVDRSFSMKETESDELPVHGRLKKSPTARPLSRANLTPDSRESSFNMFHEEDAKPVNLPLGSMSLSRRMHPNRQYAEEKMTPYERYKKGIRTLNSSRQRMQDRQGQDEGKYSLEQTRHRTGEGQPSSHVARSISMRHTARPAVDQRHQYSNPLVAKPRQIQHEGPEEVEGSLSSTSVFASQNPFYPTEVNMEFCNNLEPVEIRSSHYRSRDESEDSESPRTRTWANPAIVNRTSNRLNSPRHQRAPTYNSSSVNSDHHGRKASRSHSMRDVSDGLMDREARIHPRLINEHHMRLHSGQNYLSAYSSDSEESCISVDRPTNIITSADLNYDSQHRLNESGLPDPKTVTNLYRPAGSSSYLGLSRNYDLDSAAQVTSLHRPTQITGRAMSQQSLSRPSMPVMSSKGRRRGNTGSRAGSDVGGSSMSLMSRLNGRYEDAHTRAPVVMYIPEVSRSTELSSSSQKTNAARRSSRLRHSSQDRGSRKSLGFKNGSDSESSSMLRTLVKPKAKLLHTTSKRSSRRPTLTVRDNHDEDLDDIAQLATEIDSYKFRRRYSVPKDAKINWFAKLKQRVSSTVK